MTIDIQQSEDKLNFSFIYDAKSISETYGFL